MDGAQPPGFGELQHRSRSIDRAMLYLVAVALLSSCSALQGLSADVDDVDNEDSVFPQPAGGELAGATLTPAPDIFAAGDAESALLTEIYERASPSVVNVESAFTVAGSGAEEKRRGSGFVYDRMGHVVTNAHLVKDADSITVTLHNAWVTDARLQGLDSFSDLAVLKIETAQERLTPLEIGESANLKVGQLAISIGSPFGLNNSMTMGIVSGLGRSLRSAELIDGPQMPGFDNPSIIQIDTPINPGTSGGPLLDSSGQAIGITTAIRSDNGVFQGVGFAVPADTMRRVVPELIERGRVDYAWMGLSVMPEDGGFGVAGLSEALGLTVERGVLLKGVTRGSPAALAGLRGGHEIIEVRGQAVCSGGDLIVAINDYHIKNLDDLNAYLIQNTVPGDEIELLVIREKRTFKAQLTLQPRPKDNRPTLDCDSTA
ncbi:MAG: trypsin-like peptidase domain-containing protein [Chloroflexi bacterium]|nr:trypsin-like peptidase domain-containing protein [Chloroflexota bacterium]